MPHNVTLSPVGTGAFKFDVSSAGIFALSSMGYDYRSLILYNLCGWARFQLSGLSSGAVINSATLNFVAGNSIYAPGSVVGFIVRGHAADDSAGPTNYTEAVDQCRGSSATVIGSSHSVYPTVTGTVISWDIRDVVQEVVSRTGFVIDGHLTLLWDAFRASSGNYFLQPVSGITLDLVYTLSKGDVVTELDVSQIAVAQRMRSDLTHTLTFDQNISLGYAHSRVCNNSLVITQTLSEVVLFDGILESLLLISQDVSFSKTKSNVTASQLSINQDVSFSTNRHKQCTSTLTIVQDAITVGGGKSREVNDLIVFVQDLDSTLKGRDIVHSLAITQDIVANPILQITDDNQSSLTLGQDISVNVVRTRPVEHTLDIRQSVLAFRTIPRYPTGTGPFPGGSGGPPGTDPGGGLGQGTSPSGDITKVYYPQAGEGTSFPPDPTLVAQDMVLDYPPTSPTLSITLPSPLFSNREELTLTRIQRRTRGGELKTFSDPIWPKVRVFRYKFDSLQTDKIEEFFSFLGQTLGLKIRLTDYEGRQWDGYIVNPNGESAQFFRICGKTTEFDFDGVEVP